MESMDKTKLSTDMLQQLMIAASDGNIKKIKEIIAESERVKVVAPLIPPVISLVPPINSF